MYKFSYSCKEKIMAYYTSNAEHPINILNIKGLESRVKARMEPGAFGYIREGAEDEWTFRHDFTLYFCEYLKLFTRIYLLKYSIKSTSDSIYNSLIHQSFLTTVSLFSNI